MATSGTKTFALDIAETIEEAYELAGLEQRTGYDARTARRSMDKIVTGKRLSSRSCHYS